MISYIDGQVYIQVPYDDVDSLAVAVLKDGRELVEASLADTYMRIAENNGRAASHHLEDLHDNTTYLNAFDTLLAYYGESA